ncbi:hypothetical protein CDAR_110671 [Caerostris darwini]|uniref:Uncharacterized protein n=1 Tax=Caerostris darwini TaxID=1538125 RepID=A0AAV4S5Z5_9ARAC|nr:hypothetical protein CDAR_110671 [Caerostris darwini]
MSFFLFLGSIRDNPWKVTGGEEGEKLKKFGLECPQEVSQQSCLISNEKDRSVMAFFLFLGSIRDNPLKVTGGEEGEKLKKVGLECPLEVSDQSCLMSKEKDKSVMAFFMLLGSIRDNLLRVTGGVIKNLALFRINSAGFAIGQQKVQKRVSRHKEPFTVT